MRRAALLAVLLLLPAQLLATASYPGEKPTTWDQPSSREQAARESTLVPVGKGAVFVPAMSDPAREPPFLVLRDDDVVATVPMGNRAILDPGVYEILIGSGTLEDRFSRRVLVEEGRTTVVPATWSVLVIDVVDERTVPFRGSYEIIALPKRRNLGIGLGADIEEGEAVRSWVLEPGTYMVIKTGEGYQARRDFYTFRLLPGELRKMVLVVDPNDGSLLGGGEVSVAGKKTAVRDWRLHLELGGDAELNQRANVVGFRSGLGFSLGGYFDFMAQYKPEKHLFYSRFRLEEKQIKLPEQPFQKDLDELKVDLLYVYRVLPWLGPYVRAGFQTQVFAGHLYFDDPKEVVRVDDDGAYLESLGTHEGKFQVSEPFSPIEVKSGLGLSFLLTASYVFDANIRVGFGGRALFNRGLLNPRDDGDTDPYEVFRMATAYQYGLEATAVASLRLTRWVQATTELDFLEPIDDYLHPVVDWETTIGVRFVSFVSLNYIFKLMSDVERSPHLQTEHRVLLRFTWKIL